MTVLDVMNKLHDALTGHDADVARLEALEEKHAAAARARQHAIAAAQAEVDKLEEPRRRLERLTSEASAVSTVEQRERAAIENALRAHPSRELARWGTLLDRLFERLRMGAPPTAVEEHHRLTGERRVTNVAEIQKWLDVAPVLTRLRVEVRDELWRLPEAALRERLTTRRQELEAALTGTALEGELG